MSECVICGAGLSKTATNAICITVCCALNSTTSISNLSYCNECFKRIVYKPLRELDDRARLKIGLEGIEDRLEEHHD